MLSRFPELNCSHVSEGPKSAQIESEKDAVGLAYTDQPHLDWWKVKLFLEKH